MTDDLRLDEIIDEAIALIGTDLLYLERDPAGVRLDMKVPVSVLDSHFEAGAPVQSVFGRVGAVVAAGGDYRAGQVRNVAAGDIVATTVQAAIDELDAEKQSLLPAVDETPIVFKTGIPANTLTFNVTPFTAARIATWPDADINLVGDNIANTFTAAQTINVNSARALLVEQSGVRDNTLRVNTTTGRVGIGAAATAFALEVFSSGAQVQFRAPAAQFATFEFKSGAKLWQISHRDTDGFFAFYEDGTNARMAFKDGGNIGIGTINPSTRLDIADGAIEFEEMTAPAAGAANTARLFSQDNGAGKTQLGVRFPTGAIQILATEP